MPVYALLAGLGATAFWQLLGHAPKRPVRTACLVASAAALCVTLAWQTSAWFHDYLQENPALRAQENQAGLIETMRRAVAYAPSFDEVWISYDSIDEPYIYLLAARPMPSAEAQKQIAVTRRPGHFNSITGIGRYRFVDTVAIPQNLPPLEAFPNRFGRPAFVLQQWERDGKRILILRRMD